MNTTTSESNYYPNSPTGRYILYRDGVEIAKGKEADLWRYLHRASSSSVYWALRYEGYSIRPEVA